MMSVGDVLMSALFGELRRREGERTERVCARLLECPGALEEAARRVADLLCTQNSPDPVEVNVSTYDWSRFVAEHRSPLFEARRTIYEHCRVDESDLTPGTVKLHFVAPVHPMYDDEARRYLETLGFRAAHPIEALLLAALRPDLFRVDTPVTILGSKFVHTSPDTSREMRFFLTIGSQRDGSLVTFLEELTRGRYPGYHLFLAAERS